MTTEVLFQLSSFPGAKSSSESVHILGKLFDPSQHPPRESPECKYLLEAAWCITLRLYSGSTNVGFHCYQNKRSSRLRWYEFSHDLHEELGAVSRFLEQTVQDEQVYRGSNVGFCFDVDAAGQLPHEDIHLVFWGGQGLTLQFRESFMSAEEAENMLETMAHVLKLLHLHPETTVAQLGPSPRDLAALTRWNSIPLLTRDVLVHEEFAKVARSLPSHTAIHSWDGNMTYAELEQASDALARHLVNEGCGRGKWVVLCFNKTRWAMVAMLAVLKTGAASVPIDPRYPSDRVRQILENTGARMALVGGHGQDRFTALVSGADPKVNIINVAGDYSQESAALPSDISSKDPAYSIFTSGSTGTPKGVVFTHSGIASSTRTYKSIVGADETTRILQFSAFVFDVSVAEIFTSLLHGATLCIPSEEDRVSDLEGFMRRSRPTWIALTPTVARVLDPRAVARCGVGSLLLVGELVKEADIAGWIDAGVRVFNVYGPAENTLITTVARLDKGRASSVGRGANTLLWVADVERGRLLPVGAVGELVVEGPHVSPGYLNDPVRTAHGFLHGLDWIPDPGRRGGKRSFYRTGDLVRFNVDGELQCIGRSDTQVKLGGQRVELGDIETHLRRHPLSAKGAAVVVPKDGSFANRLTAVVVRKLGSSTSSSFQPLDQDSTVEVSTYMSKLVPEYMIPAVWLTTEALPVSTSGKLDRRMLTTRLQEMSLQEAARIRGCEETDESEIPLSDSPSSVIAQVCSQVLNLPIGAVDLSRSFISLGGDSISAMQASSLARRGFAFTVKVSDLLTSPNLTAVVTKMQAVDVGSTAQEIANVEIGARYGLSPIQQLFMDTATTTKARNHYHQSTFLRLSRKVEVGVLEAATNDLVRRHAMLRARFEKDQSGEWRQYLLSPEEPGSLPGLEQFGNVDSEDEMTMLADGARKSLDIENGPIMRVLLMAKSDGQQLFFMVVHHLVIDLVSWRVLLDELETKLRHEKAEFTSSTPFLAWYQLQAREAALLHPDKTIPFQPIVPSPDFDFWGLSSPVTQNVFQHVVEKRSAVPRRVADIIFDSATHAALGTDPVDVFLSAIFLSYSRVFRDRPAPPIFNEGHGREAKEEDGVDITRTVGWFTTMYPVCVGSTDCTVINLVRQVKDYRRGISRNGFGYFSAKYLNGLGREAFASHIPSEIMFNYEGRYQNLEKEDSILKPLMNQWQAGENLADQAENLQRFCLFEISAAILPDGQLHITSAWNTTTRHQDRVEVWLQMLLPAAIAEVAAALKVESPRLTLSDMTLVKGVKTYADVDRIAQRLLKSPAVRSSGDIEAIYEGSPMQDALAMSLSRGDHDGAYEIVFIWALAGDSGSLDPTSITSAWEATVARHPLLRTVFVESNTGMLLQAVLESHKPQCNVLSADEKAAAVSALLNLERPDWKLFEHPQPPHRLTICTTSENDQILVRLDIHHIIFDGMSKTTLLADLTTGCAGQLVDKPTGSTFAKFVQYINSEQRKAESVEYWRSFLADVQPCLFPKLPAAKSRETTEEARGACKVVSSVTLDQINALSLRSGAALASIIHLTWALVLGLYTGSQRPVFGHMTSGRDAPIDGIMESVGPYALLLANAIDIQEAAQKTVAEALAATQLSIARAMGHQSITLGEIHNALGLSGSNHLFNTGLAIMAQVTSVESAGIAIEELYAIDPTEFDLSLIVETTSTDLAMHLEYRTGAISDYHASNIAATTAHVLETLIMSHDLLVGNLLNGPSSRDQRQIWDWNAELISPATECIDQMFLSAVAQHPDRQAIDAWDGSMTYAELGEVATRLARHLKGLGVGPETPVPLCFEKSIWAIVAVHAVLLTGGYFVMLDPAQPDARLSRIVEEVDARLILCSPLASKSKDLAAMTKDSLSVVEVSGEYLESLPPSKSPVEQVSTPETTAYIVFTSGSTGVPKGAVVTHSALRTGLPEFAAACAMPTAVRALQFASFTFDASLADIFLPLLSGGCVCLPAEEMRNPVDIAAFITRTRANWAGITPSMASLIDPASVPTLKALTLSGEALTSAEIDAWADRVALTNMYGPSECSIACVANTGLSPGDSSSNIGRGFRCVTWIVEENDQDRLVPIGAIGELLIEGPALARDYLNNPEQTARVFITSPPWLASRRPDSRLYKTGDLVHYNADGTITFVGRKDLQIKINGQRVETGEIENGLRRMVDPDENVLFYIVDLPRQNQQDPMLVAFVSFADAEGIRILRDESHLRRLRSVVSKVLSAWGAGSTTLSRYMIPQAFIPVGRLPMMTSGKINRKALREAVANMTRAELVSFASDAGAKPPVAAVVKKFASPLEELLGRLWRQVLQVDSVDRDSHFVRLGGNSIAAIKLRGEAWRCGLDLSVADVFSCPVLADMAQLLHHKAPVSVAPSPSLTPPPCEEPFAPLPPREVDNVPVPRQSYLPFELVGDEPVGDATKQVAAECHMPLQDIQDVFPCTPVQEGLMTMTLLSPAAAAYSLHLAHRLPRDIDLKRFGKAWEDTTLFHDLLRSRMVLRAKGSYMAIAKGPVRMQNLKLTGGVEEYLDNQKKTPFAYGLPLLRMALVEGQDAQCHFVMSIHHSIYDGWSMKLIYDTFLETYHGKTIVPGTPFQLFAKDLSIKGTQESMDYWRRALEGGVASDEYPFPPVPSTHKPVARASSSFSFDFPIEMVSKHGVTPALFLQAAWALCLSQYSSSSAPIFGVVLSGRDSPVAGVETIVGPMITTAPRRFEVDRGQSLGRFLDKAQAVAVGATPHQHLGLHRIQSLSDAARQACNFSSLVLVNVREEGDQSSPLDSIGAVLDPAAPPDLHPYPIALEFTIVGQKVELVVYYDPVCVDEQMVVLISMQVEHLVGRMSTASPETDLMALYKDVSPFHVERVVEWNSECEMPDVPTPLIQELVSHWAKTTPSAMAVDSHDAKLSFAQLDTYASQLASHIAQTVDHDKSPFIGACLEKSAAAIVTILGILKSGHAYMPLNCGEAPARLQAVVKQAGVGVILASEGQERFLVETLPWCRIEPISMAKLKTFGCAAKPRKVAPQDPAYILMTSGTTGTPKLVLMEHGSWAWANAAHGEFYKFSSQTRSLQYASYTFDSSLIEIFGVLTNGGCVAVPSETERRDDVAGFMRDHAVTFTQLPPTVARLIPPRTVPTLNFLGMGAERITAADVDPWAGSGVELFNLYGPSEACVVTVGRRIDPDNCGNIGRPVGSNAWVVNRESRALCPVGAAGELWLSGPMLARGYFGDEQRTGESFVRLSIPSGRGVVVRAYRTGDMVRLRSDGTLDFLGRRDSQIKVRGQRVDVGEIKHHVEGFMRGKLQFRQAAIHFYTAGGEQKSFLAAFIAVDTPLGGKVLDTACVGVTTAELGGSGVGGTAQLLREHLGGVLPSYMLPYMFVFVNRMPETTAGKLNSKFLDELVRELLVQRTAEPVKKPVISLSPAERILRKWWAKVIDIEEDKIHADDDFFGLGATSVSAIRLAGVARSNGQRLSYANISRNPVLSDMARKITMLSRRIEVPKPFELLPNGKDGLEVLLAAHDVPIDTVEDIYAATPLQETLLAASARHPAAYTMFGEMKVPRGRVQQLKEAWAAAVSSFELMRTVFISDPVLGLLQVVLRPREIHWGEFDHAQDLVRYVHSQDPSRCPLSFATVPAGEDVMVLFSMHHSIYDGRSLQLLMQKLEFRMAGRHDDKPGVPFSVFVKYIKSLNVKEAKDFWRSTLQGFSGQKLSVKESKVGKTQALTASVVLPPTASLSRLGGTLSTAAHAAWLLTLSHFTGNSDAVFGSTVSGRAIPGDQVADVEGIFGPTIATVPFRANIDYSSGVASFLSGLQRAAIDMEKYGQVGLDTISSIDESCKAACDFDTIFNFQFLEEADGVEGSPPWRPLEHENFFTNPVAVDVQTSKNGPVEVVLTHSPAIDPRYAASLLNIFVTILQNLVRAGPQDNLCDVAALSPHHLSSLVDVGSSNGPFGVPAYETVLDRIRTQAELNPSTNALESWDGSLTYAALDELSTALARKLAGLRVKAGDKVCFMFEKSRWAVVAMLGILKAGCCMVPCDPASKLSRLEYIVDATGAPLMIVSPKCLPIVQDLRPRKFVLEDGTLPMPKAALLGPRFDTPARPCDPAYILFTSGSTGVPKGVVVQHQTLASTLGLLGVGFNLGPHTRCFQFNSYWFDIMLLDIFGPLTHGGCVCVPSDDQKLNQLAGSIDATRSNFITLSTSVSRLIEPEKVPSLTTICLGGEPVRQSDVDRWAPRSRLVAGYGPTEACIICVLGDLGPGAEPSVIGRPVGCRAWVVNPTKPELAPFGAVGELLVEGPNLAAGYLDQEKTREAFLPTPAWIPGTGSDRRVYKTGDLVRWNPDGTLSYVGRKEDGQVKIRGHRVELGEIEEVIRQQLPGITVAVDLVRYGERAFLCVVLGIEDPDRDARLAELRRQIDSAVRAALAAHMVPDVYLALPKIPTTSTGKLDRAALKEAVRPALAVIKNKPTRESPLSPKEQRLAALWGKVLSLDDSVIESCDSFFALGGDSIKAMKLVALARKDVVQLTVAKIFAQPTLAGMAEELQFRDGHAADGTVHMNAPAQRHAEASKDMQVIGPCTDYQATFVAGAIAFPGAHTTQHVFKLHQTVDMARLRAAVDACVAHFPALRARIVQDDKGIKQTMDFSEAVWSWREGQHLDELLASDAAATWDLGQPLHHISVLKGSNGPTNLVWTMSHAAYDAACLADMLSTIDRKYSNPGLELPPTLPLGEFSQHAAASWDASRPFWSSYLSSLPTPTLLFRYATISQPRQDTVAKFRAQIPRRALGTATASCAVVAAWILTLAKRCGDDVTIAHLMSGRTSGPDGVEACRGPTITKVPLRVRAPPRRQARVGDVAASVARGLAAVLPHQHSGIRALEQLVRDPRTGDGSSHAGAVFGRLPLDLAVHPPGYLSMRSGTEAAMVYERSIAVAPPPGGLSAECSLVKTDSGVEVDIMMIWDSRAACHAEVGALVEEFKGVLAQG